MKLKSLEIYGFKSFAGRSKLGFDKNISAIVGPNGSGKSNISDAVRWVLGEQSAKSLRGDNMADVIFSGTDDKKQMNMANVTLILDNSDRALNIDYNEVSITRKVFRNGDSEYLINKAPVRLKDIKELFLDTGIGKDGYSIIGQGRIDNILNGKSEDRRYLFEEASGIAKFKFKKQEAERKLIKNDESIAAIKSEMKIKEQEVAILEKQANNAREGVKLTKELERLEISYLKNNMKKIDLTIQNLYSEKAKFNNEINNLSDRLNYLLSKNEPQVKEISELEFKLKSKEQDKIKEDRSKDKIKSENAILEERLKFLISDLDRIEKDIESRKERKDRNLQNKIEIKNKTQKLKQEIGAIKKDIEEKKDEIISTESRIKEFIKQIDDLGSDIAKNKDLLSDLNVSRLTKDELDKSNLENLEKILKQIDDLDKNIEDDKQILSEKELEIKSIEKKTSKNISDIDYYSTKRREQVDIINNLQAQLDEHSQIFYKLKSKKDILYSVYKSYEGYYKPIQNLLKIRDTDSEIKSKIVGVLADLVSIDGVYKTALDVTLGPSLQNIVVENEHDGKFLINFIKKKNLGRVTFLPINKIQGKKYDLDHPLVINSLNNLVKNDHKIQGIIDHFLSRTLLVKSMDHAIKVSEQIKGFRLVTLDGEIINSWGSMVGGSFNKKDSASLINRQEELNIIASRLNDISKKGKELKEELSKSKAKLNEINNELNKIDIDNNRLGNKKSTIVADIKELKAKILINTNSLNENKKQVALLKSNIKEIDYSQIKDLEKSISDRINSLKDLKTERNLLLDKKIQIEKDEIKNKSSLETFERDLLLLNDNLNQITVENDNIDSQLLQDEKFRADLNIEIEEISNNIKNNADKIGNYSSRYKAIINDIDELNDRLEIIKSEASKELKEIDLLKDQKVEIEKELFQLDLKLDNENNRKEEIINQYLDSYDISKDELLTNIENIKEIKVNKKDIIDVKNKLSRIGFFNFTSIEEYNIEKEELDFIMGQYQDLVDTREDILKMIKTLERDMRAQFKQSFSKINENFAKVFAVLFNGGQAELVLEGDDILTAGIGIIAKPPGKKLKNLALLSGGEKALTAVALLFAIFQINPAPFCILDEIDAALDEANIKRYITYLKSLVNKTQFIIITHRKVTMEMADILYGVTMEEKGISKVITLALDDYKEA